VGERPGGRLAAQAPVDRQRFGISDHDRERALAVHLFEVDELGLGHLADDDLAQLHLDGHSRAPR
jgi:hypothetical protein